MKILIIAIPLIIFCGWYSHQVDKVVASTTFCFDSNGNHYVAPNANCNQ